MNELEKKLIQKRSHSLPSCCKFLHEGTSGGSTMGVSGDYKWSEQKMLVA